MIVLHQADARRRAVNRGPRGSSGVGDRAYNLQPVEEGGEAMKPSWIVVLVAVLAVTVGLAAPPIAVAQVPEVIMEPSQEAPVCSSFGEGTFSGTISPDKTTVTYKLTYNLTGLVTQAHIHLAQAGVSGGISVWLRQTPGSVDPTGLSPQCGGSEVEGS